MSLTLIKEDGSGKTDANSYASAVDGDSYHEGHLYADAWQSASTERKEAALVMATRVIDAEYQFNGRKSTDNQALQWPRYKCPDSDSEALWRGDAFVSSDAVPAAIVAATCEMARELLVVDRTASPPGEGLSEQQNADLTRTVYSKRDTRPIISHLAQGMLGKYGVFVGGGSAAVKLERT